MDTYSGSWEVLACGSGVPNIMSIGIVGGDRPKFYINGVKPVDSSTADLYANNAIEICVSQL